MRAVRCVPADTFEGAATSGGRLLALGCLLAAGVRALAGVVAARADEAAAGRGGPTRARAAAVLGAASTASAADPTTANAAA